MQVSRTAELQDNPYKAVHEANYLGYFGSAEAAALCIARFVERAVAAARDIGARAATGRRQGGPGKLGLDGKVHSTYIAVASNSRSQ